jgi:hypothetical protein
MAAICIDYFEKYSIMLKRNTNAALICLMAHAPAIQASICRLACDCACNDAISLELVDIIKSSLSKK